MGQRRVVDVGEAEGEVLLGVVGIGWNVGVVVRVIQRVVVIVSVTETVLGIALAVFVKLRVVLIVSVTLIVVGITLTFVVKPWVVVTVSVIVIVLGTVVVFVTKVDSALLELERVIVTVITTVDVEVSDCSSSEQNGSTSALLGVGAGGVPTVIVIFSSRFGGRTVKVLPPSVDAAPRGTEMQLVGIMGGSCLIARAKPMLRNRMPRTRFDLIVKFCQRNDLKIKYRTIKSELPILGHKE